MTSEIQCPVCHLPVGPTVNSCPACRAVFAKSPRPKRRKSAVASTILKLAAASVLLPAAGFLIGQLLINVIPGCRCSGNGCSGCGADDLISFMMLGGFVGALCALIFVCPVALVAAVVASVVQSRSD